MISLLGWSDNALLRDFDHQPIRLVCESYLYVLRFLRNFFLLSCLPAVLLSFRASFLPSCLPAFLPSCLPAFLPPSISISVYF